jgi:hypothetical protein
LSYEFRPLKDIKFDLLIDGRLEKYGVQADNGPSTVVLTGTDGSTVIASRESASTHFEFHQQSYPQQVFDAISREFGAELAGEDDFRFWGFSSLAEMVASCNGTDDYGVRSHELRGAHWILVEAPGYGDAEFSRQWLQSAIDADRLLRHYLSEHPGIRPQIARLEVTRPIEFASAAQAFVEVWRSQVDTFLLDLLDSRWAEMLCVMALVGFFTQTGERYQMTVPKDLKVERIRDALIRLAETEDSKRYTHPEKLLLTLTWMQSFVWKERLEKMTPRDRLADRDALLAE